MIIQASSSSTTEQSRFLCCPPYYSPKFLRVTQQKHRKPVKGAKKKAEVLELKEQSAGESLAFLIALPRKGCRRNLQLGIPSRTDLESPKESLVQEPKDRARAAYQQKAFLAIVGQIQPNDDRKIPPSPTPVFSAELSGKSLFQGPVPPALRASPRPRSRLRAPVGLLDSISHLVETSGSELRGYP